MDAFTDIGENNLKRRAADGSIMTIVQDSRLHWVDAPFIDAPITPSGCRHPSSIASPCSTVESRTFERPVRLFRLDPRETGSSRR